VNGYWLKAELFVNCYQLLVIWGGGRKRLDLHRIVLRYDVKHEHGD
jgi:hypothetical protein